MATPTPAPLAKIPEKKDSLGCTLMMEAAKHNLVDKIKECVAMGHDVNAVDNVGWNALQHAVINEQEDAAVTLLNAGINPVQPNKMGDTPLMEACRRKIDTVVTRIAKAGVSLDAQEKVNGHTAVMVAIESGDGYAACILAEHGADTSTLQSKKGQTAEQMARVYFTGKNLSCFENIVLKKKTTAAARRQQELQENIQSATVLTRGIKPLKTLRFTPKKAPPATGAHSANG